MKQCAIVLNGNDIVKISNLKRKYNKIINNPTMSILEECELEELESKYNYYKKLYKKESDSNEDEIKLYYYKYVEGPCWHISIYELNYPQLIPKTKQEYDKAFTRN